MPKPTVCPTCGKPLEPTSTPSVTRVKNAYPEGDLMVDVEVLYPPVAVFCNGKLNRSTVCYRSAVNNTLLERWPGATETPIQAPGDRSGVEITILHQGRYPWGWDPNR
jgi:hypothetical protein